MRLNRPRFTVRRLMVAVAAAALLLCARRLWQRSVIFANLAGHHALKEHHFSQLEFENQVASANHRALAPLKDEVTRQRYLQLADQEDRFVSDAHRFVDYHDSLVRKYLRAAHFPWLPIEPDPPQPK